MAYARKTWVSKEKITTSAMNNIEGGIESATNAAEEAKATANAAQTQVNIISADATVDDSTGTPAVSVSNDNLKFTFQFTGLKGAEGDPGTPGTDGDDGGYYTPSVSAAGDLSWTASKTGMASVDTVNIKGPAGTYTAGTGIKIADDTISVDESVATQDDLSGYLPTSGGTVAGAITFGGSPSGRRINSCGLLFGYSGQCIDCVSSNAISITPNGGTAVVIETDSRISGVTAGTDDTDAVNVAQLNEIITTKEVEAAAYTNLVTQSTDIDGAIYNGTGIKSGYRLNSSGSETEASALYVTGFIPVSSGDVIRVQDPGNETYDTSVMYALYTDRVESSTNVGKTVADISGNELYGALSVSGNTVTWDTSSISYYFWNDFSYVRITSNSADVIVTVNEEIEQTTVQEKWLASDINVPASSVSEASSNDDNGTCVVFGDSIIGMVRDSTAVTAFAEQYSDYSFYNVGFGGCRMSEHPTSGYAAFSMYALADAIVTSDFSTQEEQAASGEDYFPAQLATLESIDFSTVDAVVIHYGTNDFNGNVIVDNAEDDDDTTTLCGALRYSLNKLLGAFKNLKIYVSVPLFRVWDGVGSDTYENSNSDKLTDFVQALIGVAQEYHLPVINGYANLGINLLNEDHFLLEDGTHLTESGRKTFGKYIGQQIA